MWLCLPSSVDKGFHRNGPREVHPVIDRDNLENREILPWEAKPFGWIIL